jgi:quercetin dioxygenase-like cupin family protein
MIWTIERRFRVAVVKNYHDVKAKVLKEAPGVTVRWVLTEKDGTPHYSIRIFEFEPGATLSLQAKSWEDEIFILSGTGLVRGEDSETPVQARSAIFVAPGEAIDVVNTGEGVLRYICATPLYSFGSGV